MAIARIKTRPTRISRDGRLLLAALRKLCPEAIQLPVTAKKGALWSCYRRYVPMIFIPIPAKGFHGLFIETNVAGGFRGKRESFAAFIERQGYALIPEGMWHEQLKDVESYLADASERWNYKEESEQKRQEALRRRAIRNPWGDAPV